MLVTSFHYGEPPQRADDGLQEQAPEEAENPIDIAKLEENAFERGRMHERAEAEKNLAQEIDRASREVAQVLRNFEVERLQHLRKVEAECAGLALAIACKILQREAETDPLLMQAAVRIALERVDAASEIRLRVPLKHADSWTASLAGTRIAVIADVSLPTEDLVLETEIGTAELGWTAQIKEIEREFLETLNARPGTLQ